METRVLDLLRDGIHEMNEDLEAINESVSLGNAGDAAANLAPRETGVALGTWLDGSLRRPQVFPLRNEQGRGMMAPEGGL